MVRLDFDLDDFFGMVDRFRYGGGWWRQDVPMSLRGCLIRAFEPMDPDYLKLPCFSRPFSSMIIWPESCWFWGTYDERQVSV